MRSRFCAFAVGDADYLLSTWHRGTRPKRLDLDDEITWRRLQIVDTTAGGEHDTEGEVVFRAQYERDGTRHLMTERSSFTRSGDRWVYVDGDVTS
jgi:SEC-C motif domain protein